MARASSEKRKELIILAVLDLFREKGMAASSTRDIAERTGLARSHIYHYFKDWKELCLQAVEYFSYQELTALQQSLLSAQSAREALSLYIQDYLPTSQDASWSIYLDGWNESLRDPIFAEHYQKIIEAWRAVLTQILQTGVASGDFQTADLSRLTRQITALINGYADELIVDPNPQAYQRCYQDILAAIDLLVRPSSSN